MLNKKQQIIHKHTQRGSRKEGREDTIQQTIFGNTSPAAWSSFSDVLQHQGVLYFKE